MNAADFLPSRDDENPRIIWGAVLVALAVEALLLVVVGNREAFLGRPTKAADESNFIEAQVFVPQDTHLVEQTKPVAAPAKPEVAISKDPNKGRVAKPDEKVAPEENKTEGGPQLAPTHGPVAIFSPSPKIPPSLQEGDLHASVVIDFFVAADGTATPRLVGSSGNEELDAIAIDTAKKWRFHAAEQDHKALDAKVRLRILFEVQ
jgi:TonB family protein